MILPSIYDETLSIKSAQMSSFMGCLCCFLSGNSSIFSKRAPVCRGQRFAGTQTDALSKCVLHIWAGSHPSLAPRPWKRRAFSLTPLLILRVFFPSKEGEVWKRIHQQDGRRLERGLFFFWTPFQVQNEELGVKERCVLGSFGAWNSLCAGVFQNSDRFQTWLISPTWTL